jgi:hypothetical protein
VVNPHQDQVSVWHTENSGGRWVESTLNPAALDPGDVYLSAVGNRQAWLFGAAEGLAGSSTAILWRTVAEHPTWTPVWKGTMGELGGLHFFNAEDGVYMGSSIVGNHTNLFYTQNAGVTWSRSDLRLPPGHFFPRSGPPRSGPHHTRSSP